MTAIVAVPCVRRGRLVFGGDAAVTYPDGEQMRTSSPKVRRVGGYLLGAAGDGAWFALLGALEWPVAPGAGYPEATLARDLRDAAKRLGIDDADGAAVLGAVIDGTPRIWIFDSALMIDAVEVGHYAACGSGAGPALGALYAAKGTPEQRATKALEAASIYRADVRPPFTLLRY